MLGIFVIAGCVLMTCAGPPISGYSLGTLSGGRGQEYSSGYRTGGFIGMKDSQGDLSDHLGGGGYAAAGTNRYSVITGGASSHQSPSTSYTSDPGFSDASSSHSSAYGGHSNGGNPEALALSSSSYSSDLGGHGSSSDLAAGGYSSAGSSAGLGGYSSAGSTSGNQVGSGFVGYSEGTGGHAVSSHAERAPAEYSTSSHPSSSYVSYSVGGPKASAYTASSGGPSHGISYSSSPSVSYMSGGHHGGSSHPSASSYSSESSHPGISSAPSYTSSSSSSSLGNFLSSMHSGGPSNYIPGSSGGPRGNNNHLFAISSNHSPNYSSRGPSTGYYSSSPYPRGGGKIVIVKEGGGGRPGQMYPGEQHSYSGGMFGGASGGGYKIRSVGSSPSYGPSYSSGYSSNGGYSGGGGHSSSNHGGSFFGLL